MMLHQLIQTMMESLMNWIQMMIMMVLMIQMRQRQEQIAPHKEKAIEDCITKRRRDRDYCESYNRNYGQRTAGGTSAGMFWGLPVCEEAVAAEKYFRMNPGKKTYKTTP